MLFNRVVLKLTTVKVGCLFFAKTSSLNGIVLIIIGCQKSLAVFFIEFSIIHKIGYNNAI